MTVPAKLKDFRVCLMITNRPEVSTGKTPTWMLTRHARGLLCIQRRTFHAKTTQITLSAIAALQIIFASN